MKSDVDEIHDSRKPELHLPSHSNYLFRGDIVKYNGLQGTIMAYIINPKSNKKIKVRILLDSGANLCLITKQLQRKLNLEGDPTDLRMSVAGGSHSMSKELDVGFFIQSLDDKFTSDFKVHAKTIKEIGTPFSPVLLKPKDYKHLNGIQFTEEYPVTSTRPFDMLLAEPYYSQLMCPDQRVGELGEPVAKLSKLGWILRGAMGVQNSVLNVAYIDTSGSAVADEDLDKFYRASMETFDFHAFWKLEHIGISEMETDLKSMTQSEVRAVARMKEVSFHDPVSKKWFTELLWKDPSPAGRLLSNNYACAKAIMYKTEEQNRLKYKDLVCDAYAEMPQKGWVEKVPQCDEGRTDHPTYVMTSRAVVKPERKTTKARCIINASKMCPI